MMENSKINDLSLRIRYFIGFLVLLLTEIIIALFVRDRFIRPYGGDILVTVLLCCLIRIFAVRKIRWLPLWVFIFAAMVEIGQYFNFALLLGIDKFTVARIALGSTFSFADLLCYAVGCGLFFAFEQYDRKKRESK